MTFIASVVAKNGVAVIADSLVTTSQNVLDYDAFLALLKDKFNPNDPNAPLHLDPQDILGRFQLKPTHTKDYEEKLFQFDHWTAITTAGNAVLNGKRISALIRELLPKIQGRTLGTTRKKGIDPKPIEELVEDFRSLLDIEIREAVTRDGQISSTTFIISNYNVAGSKTRIFTVTVPVCSKTDIADPAAKIAQSFENPAFFRVVCDGQNRLSNKLLFGVFPALMDASRKIINKVLADFKIDPATIPPEYQKSLIDDDSIVPSSIFDDLKIFKLVDLSLQQAVDLARLLMRIEIDFQKYTENIPTVGGLIKIATINESGFKWKAGHDVEVGHHF